MRFIFPFSPLSASAPHQLCPEGYRVIGLTILFPNTVELLFTWEKNVWQSPCAFPMTTLVFQACTTRAAFSDPHPASHVSCAYLQEACGKPVWWCECPCTCSRDLYVLLAPEPTSCVLELVRKRSWILPMWCLIALPPVGSDSLVTLCPQLLVGFIRSTKITGFILAFPYKALLCAWCDSHFFSLLTDDQTIISLSTFITWLTFRKGLLCRWKLHIYHTHILIFLTPLSCLQHALWSLLNDHQNAKEQLLRKVGSVGFSLKPWKLQSNLTVNCSEHYSKVYNLLCSELLWQYKMLWNCLSSLVSVL